LPYPVVVVTNVKVGLNENDALVKVVVIVGIVKLKLVGRVCVKLKLLVGIVTVG